MAWCRQATSHYLSQCWPRSLSPYDVTRTQWVNSCMNNTPCIGRILRQEVITVICSLSMLICFSGLDHHGFRLGFIIYPPLQRSWKGCIQVSLRPSVRLTVRLSVRLLTIVPTLYLPQYWSDPFHICTSYQATSGVSRVRVIAKFFKIWIFCKCLEFVTLTLSFYDMGSDVNH